MKLKEMITHTETLVNDFGTKIKLFSPNDLFIDIYRDLASRSVVVFEKLNTYGISSGTYDVSEPFNLQLYSMSGRYVNEIDGAYRFFIFFKELPEDFDDTVRGYFVSGMVEPENLFQPDLSKEISKIIDEDFYCFDALSKATGKWDVIHPSRIN